MKNRIHTPDGVRDIFGIEAEKKRALEDHLGQLYASYGYETIETPSFEFFELYEKQVGTTRARDMFKFFDREGNTLVLRPDITPAVARSAAMYFADEAMPIRLCYRGNVFINHSELRGNLKESTQMGIELLGDDSPEADAELLALVIRTMLAAGLTRFQVSISHIDFFRSLTRRAGLDEEAVADLTALLSIQNRFGAKELIDGWPLSDEMKGILNQVPDLFGDVSVLARARALAGNEGAAASLDRLGRIYEILTFYGLESYVIFDLSMMSEYRYYTGIVFQAYTYGAGEALIRGGRYDSLIKHFGKDAAAVGFAARVDSLLAALDRQSLDSSPAPSKTMLLYPAYMEQAMAAFAGSQRERGLRIACVRFQPRFVLDDYRKYGLRNRFGGILYFRSFDEAYSINLLTGETESLDVRALLADSGEVK